MGEDGLEHILHAAIPIGTAILGAALAGPIGYAAATYGAIIGAGVGAAGIELYEHVTEK